MIWLASFATSYWASSGSHRNPPNEASRSIFVASSPIDIGSIIYFGRIGARPMRLWLSAVRLPHIDVDQGMSSEPSKVSGPIRGDMNFAPPSVCGHEMDVLQLTSRPLYPTVVPHRPPGASAYP